MGKLSPWSARPIEEAHLFNPAFCGALTSEFVRAAYNSARKKGVALPLLFCALPIALHSATRSSLPASTITSPFTWLERHPEAAVGFQSRAANLVPFIREGLMFAAARKSVEIDEAGELVPGRKKTVFTDEFLDEATQETRDVVIAARFLGRWFSNGGDPATILAGWGITV